MGDLSNLRGAGWQRGSLGGAAGLLPWPESAPCGTLVLQPAVSQTAPHK